MAGSNPLEGEVFVGLDAEFFFVKDEEVVPAHQLLPSKENPRVVAEDRSGASQNSKGRGVEFHYDGIQAEFSAVESRNPTDVVRRVRVAMNHACELAEASRLAVSLQGTIPVDVSKFPEYPADAVEFGCDADYISWLDGMANTLCCVAEEHDVRYAGTHLHLGVPENETNQKLIRTLLEPASRIEVVKTLDYLVGNTSVLLDQSPYSTARRKLYGKAGTFRPTEYGVEYRVLSSFMMVSPHLLPTLWALARESIRLVLEGRQEALFDEIFPGDVIQAINKNSYLDALTNFRKIRKVLDGWFEEGELVSGKGLDQKPLDAIEFASQISLGNLLSEKALKENWGDDSLPTWAEGYFHILERNLLVDDFGDHVRTWQGTN